MQQESPPVKAKLYKTLKIETEPTGATVTANKGKKNISPTELQVLAVKSTDIYAELKGYKPKYETVRIPCERSEPLKLILEAVSKTGQLYANVTPSDALVSFLVLKEKYKRGMELEEGSYDLEISKKGYETKIRNAKIGDGKKTEIEVELIKASEERGTLEERRAEIDFFVNESIYFAFNSTALSFTAREILDRKAEFLRNHPDASVVIEGHSDGRGSAEYNLAIAKRRAESVKTYLVRLGISPSRLTTVTYGDERPMSFGTDEVAWARNRRVILIIE